MAQDTALKEAKKELRRAARARRGRAFHDAGGGAAPALRAHGLGFLQMTGPATVSGFHPYQEEIDCRQLLARLRDEGWTTCLPVVLGQRLPLEFRVWSEGEPLVPGAWDIPAPRDGAAAVRPDVLLVPLLAFDRAGYRLGYGGGFYDRTLALLRAEKPVIAVGVAFAGQEVENVPADENDQPLDWVLTESGPVRCGQGQGTV